MKIEIKSWYDGKILYACEAETLKDALEQAVREEADLYRASLDGASLVGASLDRASLDGASLVGASLDRASLDRARLDGACLDGASLVGARLDRARLDRASLDRARLVGASLDRASLDRARLDRASLDGAILDGASLVGASLVGASLVGASLDRAILVGAILVGARLVGASLVGASLDRASLDRARLDGARLDPIRDDLWAVLSAQPNEATALLTAIGNGRINGSSYEEKCACLVGTLANACHKRYDELPILKPNASRPAERFFLAIKIGDTPATSQFSKFAFEWVDQWIKNMSAAFNPLKPESAAAISSAPGSNELSPSEFESKDSNGRLRQIDPEDHAKQPERFDGLYQGERP